MTDIHVQPELRGGDGLRQAIAVMHDLKPRPDFILTGGDNVFDSMDTAQERVTMLFDLFTSICRDSDIPVRYCLGNHDIFGIGKNSKVKKSNPLYGRAMASEKLGLAESTYSFDHKGWRFCVVDDIIPLPDGGYDGGFTPEIMDRVGADLKAAGDRPKVICCHIPIVSVSMFRSVDATDKDQTIPARSKFARNPGPIMTMMRENNVNLVLGGHLHENETMQYEKTTYINEGAISGAWWKGLRYLSPEGFGVIDAKPDGTFAHTYHTYGWKAQSA